MDVRAAVIRAFGREDEQALNLPIADAGLDSFDLVLLRTTLEKGVGCAVPDEEWIELASANDIIAYFEKAKDRSTSGPQPAGFGTSRRLEVNMPHMAIGGLSEHWLFKEMGDMHWNLICRGLGTVSSQITSKGGERLYATFVRIRMLGDSGLDSYVENDEIELSAELSRFGPSMFFSDVLLEGAGKRATCNLMSTFAAREGGNTSLLKAAPTIPADSPVPELSERPEFAAQYRAMRKGELEEHRLGDHGFRVGAGPLAEVPYALNPYVDLNGVNLLYFASYPLISDFCERQHVHELPDRFGVSSDWAACTATLARDVFYFANCEINDSLTCTIHSLEQEGDLFKIHTSLSRNSDGETLARLFTVKCRR